MLSKEEYKKALDNIKLNYDAEYVNECNDEFCQAMKGYISVIENLIKEHFELVEKYRKLKIALDNAIKQCCIGVTGSDACNSLDELYKAFEKKVWEDVE